MSAKVSLRHANLSHKVGSFTYLDVFIGLFLMGLAGLAAYVGARLIGPQILELNPYGDTWFDSDLAIYHGTLVDHRNLKLHDRTYKHPLLSLAFCLPVYSLRAFHVEALLAVRLMMAGIAALWQVSLFGFLRLMGCRLPEAILLALLGCVSAAGMFWLPVLETYPLGSVGLIWALGWVAFVEHQSKVCSQTWRPAWGWGVALSFVTLSITVTNWLVGCVAVGLTYSRKRAVQISSLAAVAVLFFAGVQHAIFGSALPLMMTRKELTYVASPESGSPVNILAAFVCHTMVMPAIQVIAHPRTGLPLMSVQLSAPGTGSAVGSLAVGLWLALIGLGLWQLFTLKSHFRLRLMLGTSLVSLLGLHMVYTGRETFLYSLHFLPFWIGLVALGAPTIKRSLFIALVLALLISAGFNNAVQFNQAIAFYHGAHPGAPPTEQTAHPTEQSSHYHLQTALRP